MFVIKSKEDFKMEEQRENHRVRLNFSQNSKGQVQIDCTVEFDTVEECGEAMRKALDEARAITKEKGLTEVGSVERGWNGRFDYHSRNCSSRNS
jgi:hypothetical protein